MNLQFTVPLWRWQGDAPAAWYFVTVPEGESQLLKAAAKLVGMGWGMVPVRVSIGQTTWTTSLFPQADSYLLPVKASVRKAEHLQEGDEVTVQLQVDSTRSKG